jgi:Tripartite tricarboxylate transporter family receptor
VPAYFGACWGVYGTHLPGAFRNYANWAGPTKLTIGPPLYLDRPLLWFGLFAPAGTPRPIIIRLQGEVARVVREPDFLHKYMNGLGLEPILNSPEEFGRFLREDRARAELLVKRSGLQPQ